MQVNERMRVSSMQRYCGLYQQHASTLPQNKKHNVVFQSLRVILYDVACVCMRHHYRIDKKDVQSHKICGPSLSPCKYAVLRAYF